MALSYKNQAENKFFKTLNALLSYITEKENSQYGDLCIYLPTICKYI